MLSNYVEKKNNGYRITGTRISLDSIVYSFLNGQTAESIAQSFPVLTLEQVHGAITYYLANQSEIDSYLKESESQYEKKRQEARNSDPMFYQKLANLKKRHDKDLKILNNNADALNQEARDVLTYQVP